MHASLRLVALVNLLFANTLPPAAGSSAAPAATTAPPPGFTAPPPPKDDEILVNGDEVHVLVVTDAGKAMLEHHPNRARMRFILRDGATDRHLARLVAQLPWMEQLVLGGVSDLAPVARLTKLRLLHLNESRVASLAPLANHPSLESVSVNCSASFRDKDMTGLRGIATLQSVWLTGCSSVTTLRGLESDKALRSIATMRTPLADFEALRGKTELVVLQVLDAPATDLGPIGELVALRGLTLRPTQATDLSPLRSLTKLSLLSIGGPHVRDLSFINSTELTSLDVNDAPAVDPKTLPASLPKLTMLSIATLNLTDAKVVARYPQLQFLVIYEGRIRSLKPLLALRQLRSVLVPEGVSDAEVRSARRALAGVEVSRWMRPLPEDVRPPVP